MKLEEYEHILRTGTPSDRARAIAAASNDKELSEEEFHQLTALIKGAVRPGTRKLTPDAPNNKNEERHRLHEKMEREGSASADITLRTSIRMSDEAFAAALEKAKAEGRDTVHVLSLIHI